MRAVTPIINLPRERKDVTGGFVSAPIESLHARFNGKKATQVNIRHPFFNIRGTDHFRYIETRD